MGDKDEKFEEIEEIAMTEEDLVEKIDIEQSRLFSLETYVGKNPSIDKILHVFCELLKEDSGLACISPLLSNLKKLTQTLFSHLPTLRKYVCEAEMNKLHKLLRHYSQLLGKTNTTIKTLEEQAKIQRENIIGIASLIGKCDQNVIIENESTNKQFDEHLMILGKWIESSIIQDLIKEWNQFCDECRKLCDEWNKIVGKIKDKQNSIKLAIGCIGGCLLVGGILVAVIGGSIIGTPAAGASIMMAGIKIGGSFAANHALGIACVIGGVGLITLATGYISVNSITGFKVLKQAENIRNGLRQMLMYGETISNDLENQHNILKSKVSTRLHLLKDVKIKGTILKNVQAILDYLNEYINQGKKVCQDIELAQKEFVKLSA